jgi:hypothetical protein
VDGLVGGSESGGRKVSGVGRHWGDRGGMLDSSLDGLVGGAVGGGYITILVIFYAQMSYLTTILP